MWVRIADWGPDPNAGIAQLGERETEVLKVVGSIPTHGIVLRPTLLDLA